MNTFEQTVQLKMKGIRSALTGSGFVQTRDPRWTEDGVVVFGGRLAETGMPCVVKMPDPKIDIDRLVNLGKPVTATIMVIDPKAKEVRIRNFKFDSKDYIKQLRYMGNQVLDLLDLGSFEGASWEASVPKNWQTFKTRQKDH